MWRRDLEGLQLYTDVHVRSKYSKYTYNTEQSYINTQPVEIFNYLIVKLVRNLPVENRTNDYKCIIERIIGAYIVQHYENWKYVAKRLNSNKINMCEEIPYIMPFVLVTKSDKDKDQMEVYIIKHVDSNKWIKNIDSI